VKAKILKLNDLVVNEANDRHGELASERAAMNWLFENERTKMYNLARDIVREGRVFERPLVLAQGDKYVVFDGNRRVSCLKALHNPALLDDTDDRAFFVALRRKAHLASLRALSCDVEDDEEVIEKVLFRRHNGSQAGVGQAIWGPQAKTNFQLRTGIRKNRSVGHVIENYLAGQGQAAPKVRTSILDRLFSNPIFQRRAGFTIDGNELQNRYSHEAVRRVLVRVLGDEKLTLQKIWKNTDKDIYLDKLEAEGVLPHASELVVEGKLEKVPTRPEVSPSPAPSPAPPDFPDHANRPRLIPQGVTLPVFRDDAKRLSSVFHELKNHLSLSVHRNAISVLFRLLVDLTIEIYENHHSLIRHPNEKMHMRYRKILNEMKRRNEITADEYRKLTKFEDANSLFSANTMNDYVHSSAFFPSATDLNSFWDNIEVFFLASWKSTAKDSD
jgi:hypothetical protein